MATKIKLGNRPKTFKEIEVKVTLPDGEEGIIPVTFKYMDKVEFGRWQDKSAESAKENYGDEDFSWEKLYERFGDKAADRLFEIIDSWGLDEELSRKTIKELESDCGASVIPALFSAFGNACREGRLGN